MNWKTSSLKRQQQTTDEIHTIRFPIIQYSSTFLSDPVKQNSLELKSQVDAHIQPCLPVSSVHNLL